MTLAGRGVNPIPSGGGPGPAAVRTVLAQIAADEVDVPVERIRMEMGDTGRTPDEGVTAGSKTIKAGGSSVRVACAEARGGLLELAAERLAVGVEELETRDGLVETARGSRRVSYAELVGGRGFGRRISGEAAVKRPEAYRVVGRRVPRLDLPGKFTGGPAFV